MSADTLQYWALIRWGGHVPGQRPRTRLGYITRHLYEKTTGKLIAVKAYTYATDGTETLQDRQFPAQDIFHTWTRKPDVLSLRVARSQLELEE